MLPIKINVPKEFISEEIICDHLVSEKMKKVWSVQLDLLAELERVCEKHNLTYYADSGTLIGAVRHKGYIPWDDDIDITMKRTDYDKLLAIGASEFQPPYFFQSAYSDNFPRGYSRIRNSQTTAVTKRDAGKNINLGIFIDIFPLDNVPDDLLAREKWLKKIKKVYNIIHAGAEMTSDQFPSVLKRAVCKFLNIYFKVFRGRLVLRYYERICKKYNQTDTEHVSYVAFSRGKETNIWKNSSFERSYKVPFEFTQINIPSGYDAILKTTYGDYMEFRHQPSLHGKMILEPEIDYQAYMKEHSLLQIFHELND